MCQESSSEGVELLVTGRWCAIWYWQEVGGDLRETTVGAAG